MRGLRRFVSGRLRGAVGVLGAVATIGTIALALGVVALVVMAENRTVPEPAAVSVVLEAPPASPALPQTGYLAALPAPEPAQDPAPAPTAAPMPPAPRESAAQLAALPAPPPVAEPDDPAWLRNAVAIADPGGRPLIAVVIDDLGLNRTNSARVVALPGPLTLAYLTYAEDLARQTASARRAGHELLVHMPMEPMDADTDPGPDVLEAGGAPGRMLDQLRRNLAAFDSYVGINNHMGSRFTASERDMRLVLAELKSRGLLFLDSRTIGSSVGTELAARLGVPVAGRDVFLDNVPTAEAVAAQLAEVERIARARGYAVAIGHPHDATIEALTAWLPSLRERGFALAPVSAIVKRRMGVGG